MCATQRLGLAASTGLRHQRQPGDGVEVMNSGGLRLVNANTCGVKTSDICRGPAGFFSGESRQGPPQSRSLGTTVTPAVWLILSASVLLPCPQPSSYISALPVSGWSEIKVRPLCSILKSGHSSHSPFPGKGNSF